MGDWAKVQVNESFIRTYQLSDDSVCDTLIDFFESSPHRHNIGQTTNGIDVADKISTDIYVETHEEIYGLYTTQLIGCIRQYIEEFPYCNFYSSWGAGSFNIQRYMPGEGYSAWHTERTGSEEPFTSRHLVFMTYLNDVTDSGQTEFYHQKVSISPRKGLTVIWPADWTHTHRGVVSPTQTKYIATGWLNYIP